MAPILKETGGTGSAPRGQNPRNNFNMSAVQLKDEQGFLSALKSAELYAEEKLERGQ